VSVQKDIIRVARMMHGRGLVVGTVGNVSAREADVMRITPTRADYSRLRGRDLVTVGVEDGAVRPGRRLPSRELPLHLAIYRARPDVGAIVHTHSPHATAWSFRGIALEPRTEDVDYYAIGEVRCAAPAAVGSVGLGRVAAEAMGASRAVLLAGHGVLATGPTPAEALVAAEVVEHQAQIAWLLAGVPAGGDEPEADGCVPGAGDRPAQSHPGLRGRQPRTRHGLNR
jgi:L-fuculose-phosphate aldolase